MNIEIMKERRNLTSLSNRTVVGNILTDQELIVQNTIKAGRTCFNIYYELIILN